ncbi:MAG: hypothetical protein RQ756_06860, partial [Flavobacteriaceae bacterium]|nr:hypothetical protein [Flavobacteriaceae bacterium]
QKLTNSKTHQFSIPTAIQNSLIRYSVFDIQNPNSRNRFKFQIFHFKSQKLTDSKTHQLTDYKLTNPITR